MDVNTLFAMLGVLQKIHCHVLFFFLSNGWVMGNLRTLTQFFTIEISGSKTPAMRDAIALLEPAHYL